MLLHKGSRCTKSIFILAIIVILLSFLMDTYYMQISDVGKRGHIVIKKLGKKLIQHIQSFKTRFEQQLGDQEKDITSPSTQSTERWDVTGKGIMNLQNKSNSRNPEPIKNNSKDYLIATPGCNLPRTQIMTKGIKMKKLIWPSCKNEKVVATLDPTSQILQLLPKFMSPENEDLHNNSKKENKSQPCTVTEILKGPKNKDYFVLGTEKNISSKLDMSATELFVTKCGKLSTFDAHFPLKKEVQEKLDYWENFDKEMEKGNNTPFSVLFLGFDTTSRSHYYRSIPKTLNVLQKLGFMDFKGFHSILPYTLENFLAFLVGMTTSQVRAQCASNWHAPFDKCPLIWNDYNWNKFVTMYTEDGSGTFNWGGQSGFLSRPTDYYTHPLFKSVEPLKKKLQSKSVCMSTKNDQQFMLDYTKRFVQTFADTPFFSFTWFANPFHDYTYALHGLDENLQEFFKFLQSSEKLLKRTMIILAADHGERHSSFIREGYESFVERSLPGLFIRLPDLLVEKYPNLQLQKAMETNTERLTTGFDMYHTLKHLLILGGLKVLKNTSISEFQPVLKDRSSLFVPISENRDCKSINVRAGNCVCNAAAESVSMNNPFLSNKMINFAFKELNKIVSRSKYAYKCSSWRKPLVALISNHILANNTKNYTDTVLRFLADPSAEFEIQLRIVHYKNKMLSSTAHHFERISNFRRINKYKDQSWCVGFETDEDKHMKEICYCKQRPPKSNESKTNNQAKTKTKMVLTTAKVTTTQKTTVTTTADINNTFIENNITVLRKKSN